jgi:hypothetical protein
MISVLMDVDVLDRLSSIYGAFFNGGLMCFWLRQHRAQRVPHRAFGLVRNDKEFLEGHEFLERMIDDYYGG